MSVFLPCLLERWASPDGASAGTRGNMNTWQDVRRDVLRNLQWLLNTERPVALPGQPFPEAVANSVLCFGIDPYSGRAQSGLKASDVAWSIRERIVAFEPRIDRHSLEVLIDEDAHRHFNRMRFTVVGLLRANPLPLEFIAYAEIDTEYGEARVTA
ncbi:MAG: GPW/gp25 family protein [Burkholderiales bacterium]|nr:GPW/gp25 family protein [Burkholderiales bacterium]